MCSFIPRIFTVIWIYMYIICILHVLVCPWIDWRYELYSYYKWELFRDITALDLQDNYYHFLHIHCLILDSDNLFEIYSSILLIFCDCFYYSSSGHLCYLYLVIISDIEPNLFFIITLYLVYRSSIFSLIDLVIFLFILLSILT